MLALSKQIFAQFHISAFPVFDSAAVIALRSIVIVELLGLKKLNNAFGLLSLFSGIAVLVGSPMSGSYNRSIELDFRCAIYVVLYQLEFFI